MPKVTANNITMYYDQQGAGEPLILIPFLTADRTCYAFQVPEYAKHFTCFSVDLRGAGETDKPAGPYSTELFADDIAAFMKAVGIEKAHIAGLSLGAAVGAWVAAKYPERVLSLSLHAGSAKADAFIKAVVESWQLMAKAFGSVTELVIRGILPWCFTPELYATRPDYVQSLVEFIRSRPPQPVNAFLLQSSAIAAHDVESRLDRITAPTLITFGRHDMLTSLRFADSLKKIRNSELFIFEGCAHAPLYENVEEFNQKTLQFLQRQAGVGIA